jgi:hypothetical protein
MSKHDLQARHVITAADPCPATSMKPSTACITIPLRTN